MASFLQLIKLLEGVFDRLGFSSLSESGFIPTISMKAMAAGIRIREFSSLSESGFIPTKDTDPKGRFYI